MYNIVVLMEVHSTRGLMDPLGGLQEQVNSFLTTWAEQHLESRKSASTPDAKAITNSARNGRAE